MQENATDKQINVKQNKVLSKSLPKQPQLIQQLKTDIQNHIAFLQSSEEHKNNPANLQKVEKLQLRLILIDSCGQMSLLRLDHLETIFKHYCTHIFKTGKHMTFERLQYEKVHLTMERFFLFLKDFQLTIMNVGEKKQEVVDKNIVILFFKKISSNSRDLSFQQFIHCLQKLAITYYDEKQTFHLKKQRLKQQKQKRLQDMQKRKQRQLKKQLQAKQSGLKKQEHNQPKQHENEYEKQQHQQKKDKEDKQQQAAGEQNDDFVKQLMNNKDIENPNQQVSKVVNHYAQVQNTPIQQQNDFIPLAKQGNQEALLKFTNQQKIQYFYKFLVKVDSANEYREKLTALNLPIFQKSKNATQKMSASESKVNKGQDEHQRLEMLKKKMEQKKLKRKASPIPKHKDDGTWAKAQQQKRRKRQVKKEREQKAKVKNKQQTDALLQKRIDNQKQKAVIKQKVIERVQYKDDQLDWNILGKLSIEQLRINKFNPNKYFTKDDDDKIFLDEYEINKPNVAAGVEIKQRNSRSIVQDVKKRVGQVEKKQKRQEKDLQNLSRKISQTNPLKNRI